MTATSGLWWRPFGYDAVSARRLERIAEACVERGSAPDIETARRAIAAVTWRPLALELAERNRAIADQLDAEHDDERADVELDPQPRRYLRDDGTERHLLDDDVRIDGERGTLHDYDGAELCPLDDFDGPRGRTLDTDLRLVASLPPGEDALVAHAQPLPPLHPPLEAPTDGGASRSRAPIPYTLELGIRAKSRNPAGFSRRLKAIVADPWLWCGLAFLAGYAVATWRHGTALALVLWVALALDLAFGDAIRRRRNLRGRKSRYPLGDNDEEGSS